MFTRRYLMLRIVAALAIILVMLTPPVALADMAPLPSAGGSDLAPGQATQVAMAAETVVIEIQAEMPTDFGAAARVTADFTLRNLGTVPESMDVRFPLGLPALRAGEVPTKRQAQDLHAAIGGVEVPTHRQDFDGSPWAVWPIQFPPGEDVHVRVTYRVQGIDGPTYNTFFYILETGAGWRGPIGQGDIIVRFPYAADSEMWLRPPETDEALPPDGYYQGRTPPFVVAGHALRWRFSNLEPTGPDNVRLTILNPPLWQAILDARQEAAQKPDDPAAQLRLGKAYQAAIPMKHGWLEKYPFQTHFGALTEAALAKAVELAPADSAPRLAYAAFLAERSWAWEPEPYYTRARQELAQALAFGGQGALADRIQDTLERVRTGLLATPTPVLSPASATVLTRDAHLENRLADLTDEATLASRLASKAAATPAPMSPTGAAVAALEPPILPIAEEPPAAVASAPAPDAARLHWLLLAEGSLLIIALLSGFLVSRRRRKST